MRRLLLQKQRKQQDILRYRPGRQREHWINEGDRNAGFVQAVSASDISKLSCIWSHPVHNSLGLIG